MNETKKEQLMRVLGCTAEEAEDVIKWDSEIDHNKPTPFDLTKEQEKASRKARTTTAKKQPTAYKFDKRERKTNPTKSAIITEISQFLSEKSENAVENVEITNAERQISFKIGENNYELTLVQKRKPKN